jgi:hypothetical protein
MEICEAQYPKALGERTESQQLNAPDPGTNQEGYGEEDAYSGKAALTLKEGDFGARGADEDEDDGRTVRVVLDFESVADRFLSRRNDPLKNRDTAAKSRTFRLALPLSCSATRFRTSSTYASGGVVMNPFSKHASDFDMAWANPVSAEVSELFSMEASGE